MDRLWALQERCLEVVFENKRVRRLTMLGLVLLCPIFSLFEATYLFFTMPLALCFALAIIDHHMWDMEKAERARKDTRPPETPPT